MEKVSKHIYWSMAGPVLIDLENPAQKRWWIKEILTNGTMEDVRCLNTSDIEAHLPHIHLPRPVKALWSDYFAAGNS